MQGPVGYKALQGQQSCACPRYQGRGGGEEEGEEEANIYVYAVFPPLSAVLVLRLANDFGLGGIRFLAHPPLAAAHEAQECGEQP